ncbi:MAG TPA: S9 family peptidase [Acidimicrobiales bacterium]|nr:S9 family peptidase [Acidimicrobiales bacterium]
MTTTAPYGAWRSPITAASLVEQSVRLGQVVVAGGSVFWNEGRPSEAGRQVLVRDGVDVLPAGFSARTLVHEYGGQSYAVSPDGSWLVFSNQADQRLYRLPLSADGGGDPVALTAEPPVPMGVRFADPVVSPDGAWVLCVRERHLGPSALEVVNDVVAVPSSPGGGEPRVLAEGHDFFSAPRLSPDGSSLSWLSWDHPRMPWDGTELWVAPFTAGEVVGSPSRVAGGAAESVSQPRWSPSGELHFVSDRTGWWNLYRGDGVPVVEREAELSRPDWVFGQATYGFLPDGGLVFAASVGNVDRLEVLGAGGVDVPFSLVTSLQPAGADSVVAIAGSPASSLAVVRIDVTTGSTAVLRHSRAASVEAAYLSTPEPIAFPTTDGRTSHAFFYPPANADFTGPEGERPPLIVLSHGGPTSASDSVLDLGLQYWTSRGFAVVDVNYGGSTGYGRAYRQRLAGSWGIVDVDDCVHAARWLASQGRVDGDRMVIRGGSAGGYTTLAALTFRPGVFAAGASHYGVADAEALAADTHKFESRYLDGLIGPYPEARDVYVARSPIHHTAALDRPMILFQGLEDRVVPPDQAEMMAAALRERGVPFAHLTFEGEQHGFRQAATIVRVAEAELWFYGRVLGFTPGDEIEPVRIEHEAALGH